MDPLTFDLEDPAPPACGFTRLVLKRFFVGELSVEERARIEKKLAAIRAADEVRLAELRAAAPDDRARKRLRSVKDVPGARSVQQILIREDVSRDVLSTLESHASELRGVDVVPVPDPAEARARTGRQITGELPSPVDPPSGCRFRTRCPYATEECATTEPEMQEVRPNHFVACHHPLELGQRLPSPA